jgi:hypothetical protein
VAAERAPAPPRMTGIIVHSNQCGGAAAMRVSLKVPVS